jgi:hypothetical protein
VVKKEGDVYTLTGVVDSSIMDMKGAQGEQSMNSNQPETIQGNPMGEKLMAGVGKLITFQVNEKGEFVGENKDSIPEGLKGSFLQFEKPDKNNSWSKEVETEMQGMNVAVKSTYKIVSANKQEVKIESKAKMNLMIKKIEIPTTIILDAPSGFVKSMTTKTDMSMMGIKMVLDVTIVNTLK